MKKILCTVLALLLLTASASAASLISGEQGSIPNQVAVTGVWHAGQVLTDQLTDGNIYTNTRVAGGVDGRNPICIHMNSAAVSDIWLRVGDYSGPENYRRSAVPTIVQVTVYAHVGGQTATYDYYYGMDTNYNPNQINNAWCNGYQRMALPQSVGNVYRIDLMVLGCTLDSDPDVEPVVSDVVISGGGNPSQGVPGNGSGSGSMGGSTFSGGVPGVLTMRLSTRTGPSTNYTEPGSFHSKGYELTVISQAYDDRNGIWWVQVEFEYKSEKMRAYTGLKRVDCDLEHVPVEEVLGNVTVTETVANPWYGPGYNYRKHTNSISAGTSCLVYGREDGWVLVEYWNAARSLYRRVWLPESKVRWE